jgi:uncharacterized membrane protein
LPPALLAETRATYSVRIAKPILLTTTPIGVVWALLEAWRFHWWLAALMAALVAVIAVFFTWTVRRIRADRASGHSGGAHREAS